jgi:NAD(P)-dependent dehydrogenase (short-subunit alcohol dehydrogenase family)
LEGEVAIVTGSTSGLGREIARVFGSEGCDVVLTGRHPGRGATAVSAVEEAGGRGLFVPAELTDDDTGSRLVEAAVGHFGGLTVLVNNAVAQTGTVRDGPVTEVGAEGWGTILGVNLVAAALLCRAAIPEMLKAGHGSIVNVSSRAAERGTPRLAAYTASKAGLNGLTRSITIDFAGQGVRCNTVQPGYVLHERRDAELSEERRQTLEGMQLTRLATATDVAHAVAFLASRESEVVSGVTLPVDGGSTAVRGRTLG